MMPVDYGYYQHEHDYLKGDIGQSPVHIPPHYTYPAMPSQAPLPLTPQSYIQNSTNGRTSLSDIDEALESALMSPVLDALPEQQSQDGDNNFSVRIAHPELLPDSGNLMSRQDTYCLNDFVVQRTLGTGSFGRVHLTRSRHNTRFYAIKVLNKEKIVNTKQVEHTKSERSLLASVRHPFIVTLWGTFQDPENLYMVMDFVAGGELFSLLRKSKRFPDPVAKFYAAEVALILHYLHTLDIVYRDLKPENILLAADGHIKLTDFGFAKHLPPTTLGELVALPPDSDFTGLDTGVTWTLCGTPDYLAPEIVKGQPYGMSVDWYALGVLIYEMLAGYPPFFVDPTYDPSSTNPVSLYQRIAVGLPSVAFPSSFDSLELDIIQKFMTADVSERFGNLKHGVEDIFAHPWFAEVNWQKLLKKEITAPYIPTIVGDGDASQFESYQENESPFLSASHAGFPPSVDPYGCLFPDFEYTSQIS